MPFQAYTPSADDIRIQWLEAATYHGFDGSLEEYTKSLEEEKCSDWFIEQASLPPSP
jgi:hypothetical protein